ncbi:alpha/beta hydrolase [Anaeropeptidivorans aminofermentans]|uniref:alpha/beta hydrolase n=1 Tax=Anaeropeptidivorans aminofermentans TaxID=2934315 RepID=UPI002023ED15|nr:alpha/beta hydrolase-fold protein [Anaeropeptidivorans aminofermentans]
MDTGNFKEFTVEGRTCFAYVPETEPSKKVPVVLVNDGKKVLNDIGEWLLEAKPEYIVVAIEPLDRWDDYSPWPEKAPEGMGHDFGGKAGAYLNWIKLSLMPYLEKNYPINMDFSHKAMLGYSFGALAANYSMLTEKEYGVILSCSASYWYPDFIEYMRLHKVSEPYPAVYMSVGDKEGAQDIGKIISNQLKNTKLAKEILEKELPAENLYFTYQEGDHMDNVVERLKDALIWYGNYINRN